MAFLIDVPTQERIAQLIDSAARQVVGQIVSHGNEEALTSVLGGALAQKSIRDNGLKVDFRYRQHNKITEEPHSGADGSFLVKVTFPWLTVEKAALFQAKLLGGDADVRTLTMSSSEAARLQKQAEDMLTHTSEAVVVFYTWKNIYVVDAGDYESGAMPVSRTPLSQEHRLITLGTYLGKWIPRCTRGDEDNGVITRAKHLEGFKHGVQLSVVAARPGIDWETDSAEEAWRERGRKKSR
jgi:hypothetical protein